MGLCSSSNQLDPLPPTMTREKSTTNRKNNRKIKPIKEDTVDNSVDCLELSGQLETAVAIGSSTDPNDPFACIDLSGVDPLQKDQMVQMMQSTKEHVSLDRCSIAASEIQAMLSKTIADGGNSTLVGMAGALNVAAQFQGPAIAAISATLIEVGKVVPFIGIALGALGYMLKAFGDSKETDANLKMVVVWMTGVGEWLSMISDKIDDTASDNTIEMFEILNEKIQELRESTENYSKQKRCKFVCHGCSGVHVWHVVSVWCVRVSLCPCVCNVVRRSCARVNLWLS